MARAWQILYEDGSWFTDSDGAFWQAPRVGVMAILQDSPQVGVEVILSSDGWWIWKQDHWFGVDRDGKDDYRRSHISPEVCILEGRWVSHEYWRQIQAMIHERKSAWFPHEWPVRG